MTTVSIPRSSPHRHNKARSNGSSAPWTVQSMREALWITLLVVLLGYLGWSCPGWFSGDTATTTDETSTAAVLDLQFDNVEQCATFRIRHHPTPLASAEETAKALLEYYRARPWEHHGSNEHDDGNTDIIHLHVGIELVEHWMGFVSFQLTVMHYFHYLEMIAIAFAEVAFVNRVLQHHKLKLVPTWMYHPYMTPKELCGPGGGMNCMVFLRLFAPHIVAQAADHGPNAHDWLLQQARSVAHGLESNDQTMIDKDTGCAGNRTKRPGSPTNWTPASPAVQNARHWDLQNSVDAVLLIDRALCKGRDDLSQVNKMWMGYLDTFPAHEWHAAIESSLPPTPALNETQHSHDRDRMTVCYMDRQNWGRALADDFHLWLLDYFGSLSSLNFRHLRMEFYTAAQQLQLATQCDVMVGAHGNALSHQFWMKPGSWVVEMFWQAEFQFDYATIAELMRHSYLLLLNGLPVDVTRVHQHDNTLRDESGPAYMPRDPAVLAANVQRGKEALQAFVQQALEEWQQRRQREQEKPPQTTSPGSDQTGTNEADRLQDYLAMAQAPR